MRPDSIHRYDYTGMASNGCPTSGVVEAPNMGAAVRALREDGVTPFGVVKQTDNGRPFKVQIEALGTFGMATGTDGS